MYLKKNIKIKSCFGFYVIIPSYVSTFHIKNSYNFLYYLHKNIQIEIKIDCELLFILSNESCEQFNVINHENESNKLMT